MDHVYADVKRDWVEWLPFLAEGGFAALHDSCEQTGRCRPNDGPVRLVKELSQADGEFDLVRQVDTLSVFRRKEYSPD